MKRRPNIKYTDMCIWIDNNAYNENGFDETKMFQYLKDLFYALAYKKKFFTFDHQYESFSIYGATQVYLRLTNKKQFLPENDPKKLPKIKSILNFIKRVLGPAKVEFQKEYFSTIYNNEDQEDCEMNESVRNSLVEQVSSNTNRLLQIDVEEYMLKLPRTIKAFLNCSPYSCNKVQMKNIYESCLITLLRMITLSNKNYNKLFNPQKKFKLNADELSQSMMEEEYLNAPINWHLDAGMEDYITVLTNQIKKLIIRDVRDLINSYIPSDDILEDILMYPLSERGDNVDN